jgi:AbrB family looped-hinge helix DNA binding protein
MSSALVTMDEKNRVALPKEIIEKLGLKGKMLIVDLGDHIGIYPVPQDPFERLHGSFNTVKLFKELRKKAEEMAIEEVAR